MRSVTVTNETLFFIAMQYLGDATLWFTIADLNDIKDPWLSGLRMVRLPDSAIVVGGVIGQQ